MRYACAVLATFRTMNVRQKIMLVLIVVFGARVNGLMRRVRNRREKTTALGEQIRY